MVPRVVALGLWCAVVMGVGLLLTGSWPASLLVALVAGALAGHLAWLIDERLWLRAGERIAGWARRSGRVVLGALVAGLTTIVLIVVVLPVSALTRLRSRRTPRGASTWQRTTSTPDGDRIVLRGDGSAPAPALRARAAWRAPVAVTLVLLVGGIMVLDRSGAVEVRWPVVARPATGDGSRPEAFARPFEDDPAFADAPWARSLRVNLLDAWKNLEFNAAVGGWNMKDVESEYINVQDGERSTSHPPSRLGEPLTVWFFGGSAAFGAGQRDAHTIPSELVGLAARDGVAIEVHNYAVPATVNWQSAMLLVARLAWDRPPDLVVFYDGANDVALQDVLAGRGRARSDWPASLVDGEVDRLLRERAADQEVPDDVIPPGQDPEPDDPPTASEAGRLVATRYGRGVALVQAQCEAADVPVSFFWQPDLRVKNPLSPADRRTLDAVDAQGGVERLRTMTAAVRPALGRLGVHDLSSVFDRRTEPIFWDTVHTNELGAQIVASAIYQRLKSELTQLHRRAANP